MKQRPAPALLLLFVFLPFFAFADLAEPSPLSPSSSLFPFVVGGVAVIGLAIFIVVMMRRKKNK